MPDDSLPERPPHRDDRLDVPIDSDTLKRAIDKPGIKTRPRLVAFIRGLVRQFADDELRFDDEFTNGVIEAESRRAAKTPGKKKRMRKKR